MVEDVFTRFRRVRGISSPLLPSLTPLATLVALHRAGATLTLGYGDVRIALPASDLPSWLQAAITEHKAVLVDLVEELDERAAIMEYDGGLSRKETERLAGGCVLQPTNLDTGNGLCVEKCFL